MDKVLLTAAEAMLTTCARHPLSATVGEIRDFFRDDHVHAALIVSPAGYLEAVVERDDIAACQALDTAAAPLGRLTGRTVPAGASLAEVHREMNTTGRRRAAVTSADGRLLGLLCLKASRAGFCSDQDVRARARVRPTLLPSAAQAVTDLSDHFLTDTAHYADLVPPATTQLEQHDIMFSWGHFYVTLNTPAIEPVGEAISNTELFRRLAARMGFTEECFTRTDEQMMAEAFDWSAPAMAGITLESLRQSGWARLNLPPANQYAPHAEGNFPTPSGKAEFRSSIAEQAGNFVLPLFRQGSDEHQPGGTVDPRPHYVPPRETADTGYRLNLISPSRTRTSARGLRDRRDRDRGRHLRPGPAAAIPGSACSARLTRPSRRRTCATTPSLPGRPAPVRRQQQTGGRLALLLTGGTPIVQAMTLGQADSHIAKPWMLEQDLYSVVSECLADWAKNSEAAFELFSVVGLDDRAGHELRELLTRFNVPFRFVAADSGPGRHLLRKHGLDESRLPVLVRYDGRTTVRPDSAQLVAALGGTVRDDVGDCDVAIVGAGPAGLAAAVYAASEGLRTVVLEEAVSGGQAGSSPMIRNYPGFPHGISGYGLTRRTCEQAWMFGAHMVFAQRAAGLERHGDRLAVRLNDGHQVTARAVVAATGIAWRRLGVPRLEALVGSGVFYGAAGSEARAMQGRDAFVVGAGNSAGQAALHLARHARQVTMLVRGNSLGRSMSDYLIREIEATANITVRLHTEVSDGDGAERLASLTMRDRRDGRTEQVQATALFALIGGEPRTQWLPGSVQLREGYVLTGRDVARDGAGPARWLPDRAPLPLETSMPGVFAVGDVRYRSIKRVASAVGDGATAIRMVHEYLAAELTGPPVRINRARTGAVAAAPP